MRNDKEILDAKKKLLLSLPKLDEEDITDNEVDIMVLLSNDIDVKKEISKKLKL